ncbi:MAG: hypothetical protein M5U16_04560 [Hyphomicrobium sp.]|nr:hypothetical protein [Hyphomicrobium sp.]
MKYQLGHVAVLLAKVRKLDPDTEVTITFDNGTPYRFSQNEFAAHLLWLEAKHFLDSFHLNREKLLNWYDNRSGNTDRDLEQFEHIKAQFNDAEKNLLPQARTAIEKALKYQPENFAFEKILVETMWYQGDRRAKSASTSSLNCVLMMQT